MIKMVKYFFKEKSWIFASRLCGWFVGASNKEGLIWRKGFSEKNDIQ